MYVCMCVCGGPLQSDPTKVKVFSISLVVLFNAPCEPNVKRTLAPHRQFPFPVVGRTAVVAVTYAGGQVIDPH